MDFYATYPILYCIYGSCIIIARFLTCDLWEQWSLIKNEPTVKPMDPIKKFFTILLKTFQNQIHLLLNLFVIMLAYFVIIHCMLLEPRILKIFFPEKIKEKDKNAHNRFNRNDFKIIRTDLFVLLFITFIISTLLSED